MKTKTTGSLAGTYNLLSCIGCMHVSGNDTLYSMSVCKKNLLENCDCYRRGTARRAVSWNLVNCCTDVRKLAYEKLAIGRLSSSEMACFDRPYVISYYVLVCSNDVFILHCFRDITTFVV